MTFWSIGALINSITCGLLGILVYSRNKKEEINISYGLFCLSLFIWSLAYFLWQISVDPTTALFWTRLLMAAATFIPICYLHHIYSLLKETKKYQLRIKLSYTFGVVSLGLFNNPLFIKGVSSKLSFKYWPDAGPYYLPFLIFWFLFVSLGVRALIRALGKKEASLHKDQIRYVFIATIIGWLGGATNFPLWFNINISPAGIFLT